MGTTTTFDPGLVVVTVGNNAITGFAPGTFVKVERDEDTFTPTAGAGGEVAITRNRNKLGKMTITLMQGSLGNDILSALHNAHELTGVPPGAAGVEDLLGRTVLGAPECVITKPAPSEFAKDYGTREWVVTMINLGGVTGGSN